MLLTQSCHTQSDRDALAEALPERGVLVAANLLSLAAAYLFIYRGREAVKQVYNREV